MVWTGLIGHRVWSGVLLGGSNDLADFYSV